jgi:hypothetical protein
MTTTIRGHYDGKVIVPSGPVDLPRGRELVLHVEDSAALHTAEGIAGADLLRFAGAMSAEDLQDVTRVIEQGCEQVDADEW